jgi:predicted RecA/RadA family phage recombinase
MALEATILDGRRYVKLTLSAAASAGDVMQAGDGRAGIIVGSGDFASGDIVALDTECVAEIATASGTTFSAGDKVEWDDTNKLVVAAAGGDFDLGSALRAKTSGQTVTLVSLNTTNF